MLGCTHFPMLTPTIQGVLGPQVRIVDSAFTTAVAVRAALRAAGIARAEGAQSVQFMATDSPERFARVGSRFLGRTIDPRRVASVDL